MYIYILVRINIRVVIIMNKNYTFSLDVDIMKELKFKAFELETSQSKLIETFIKDGLKNLKNQKELEIE